MLFRYSSFVILLSVFLAGQILWAQEGELTLLHTGQLQGRFQQVMKVGALKDQVKAQTGAVILIDAGGFFSPYETAFSHPDGKGSVTIDMMNRAGYDAVILGHEELETGADFLSLALRDAQFTVLGANLHRPSTGRSLLYSQPYSVVQAGVFRVGILGLGDRHEGIWAGDAVLAAKYYLPIIKSQADVVVLVTSLGFEADSVLAASVPGIDLIVGRFLPDSGSKTTHVNGVSIRHAGAMGQSVGRVDLVIGKSGVTVRSAQLIPLDIPVGSIDAMTVALSSWALPVAGNALSVTATLGNCLGGFGASSGQAGAMGYLIADLMRTDSGADFALLSALSLDSEMPEGPIRVADLYRVYAPNHRLAVVEMTGEDLNRLMEDGLDDLTAFFYPSGLKITYDLTRIKGERLVSLADATGRVLGGKKKFKVAIESEIAQFSNKVKPSGSIKIRDLLAGHIRSSGAIEGKIDERLQER